MKIIDKINASIKEGKTFFSFEFFPPSECCWAAVGPALCAVQGPCSTFSSGLKWA